MIESALSRGSSSRRRYSTQEEPGVEPVSEPSRRISWSYSPVPLRWLFVHDVSTRQCRVLFRSTSDGFSFVIEPILLMKRVDCEQCPLDIAGTNLVSLRKGSENTQVLMPLLEIESHSVSIRFHTPHLIKELPHTDVDGAVTFGIGQHQDC